MTKKRNTDIRSFFSGPKRQVSTKLRQFGLEAKHLYKMGAYGNTKVMVSPAKDTENKGGQGDQGQSGLESQVSVLSFVNVFWRCGCSADEPMNHYDQPI